MEEDLNMSCLQIEDLNMSCLQMALCMSSEREEALLCARFLV